MGNAIKSAERSGGIEPDRYLNKPGGATGMDRFNARYAEKELPYKLFGKDKDSRK